MQGMPFEDRLKIRVDEHMRLAAICGKGGLEIWDLEKERMIKKYTEFGRKMTSLDLAS